MPSRFDRKAIGARASAIYRAAKASGEPMKWPDAQRAAWAEAKSPRAIERCGTKVVAHIDGAQPGGVAAAIKRVALFGAHLTEIMQTAARRHRANVEALKSVARVVDLHRVGDEWRV